MQRELWIKLCVVLIPPSALVLILVLQLGRAVTPSGRGRLPANSTDALSNQAIPKIEIDPSKLIIANSSNSPGLQLKSTQESAIPAGTRLVAIIDNSCLRERSERRATGAMKASVLTLSERAYEDSEKDEVDDLKVQAYPFDASSSMTLSSLAAEAEADECIRHVTDERVRHLNVPLSTQSTLGGNAVDDPSVSLQAHLAYLKAASAYPLFYTSGLSIQKDVVVAIVDSGVDYAHEDLAANMWRDANGKFGFNFVAGTSDPMDDLGHGTHVAGLIAAVADNGKGVSGVMGKHAKIMAVKVINASDEGTLSDFVNGLRYAADHGADVINLSLGSSETSTAERDAVAYASARGAVIVTAAGNDHKVMTGSDNDYPSGYAPGVPGMIAVGSVDTTTGLRSSFSNYSTNYVFIAAPGAESSDSSRGLLSTTPSASYRRMMGTSMASPVVAAAAALVVGVLKSEGASVSNRDVVSLLQFAARKDPALTATFKDGAVLDLERLAKAVKYRFMIDGDAGVEDAN